jgi:hypothetical protein
MRNTQLPIVLFACVLIFGCQSPQSVPVSLTTEPARLTPAEAFELIEDQLGMPDRQGLGGPEIVTADQVVDVTPEEVWQRLGGQLFQVGYPRIVLIRHGRALTLCDMWLTSTLQEAVVTDLNEDGYLEIVAHIDWGLSGRYFPYVMIWDVEACEAPPRRLVMRACGYLPLRKVNDQLVEIVVPVEDGELLIGRITAPRGSSIEDTQVTFDIPSLESYNIQLNMPRGIMSTP